jgi:hypothetical protein
MGTRLQDELTEAIRDIIMTLDAQRSVRARSCMVTETIQSHTTFFRCFGCQVPAYRNALGVAEAEAPAQNFCELIVIEVCRL